MEKNEKIRSHFEAEANEFDEIILKLIPFYREMVEALVLSVPFEHDHPIRVIDLGCGTGTVAAKVIGKFPNAQITCLDLAENMIRTAQGKLNRCANVTYLVGDFNHCDFDQQYDLAISSLALHHLISDQDKRTFYRKIYGALSDNGVFYNADVVLGSNDYLQELYLEKWKEFMRRKVAPEEVETKWIRTYQEEDSPAQLISHLKWLEEIGFKEVDVIWKYYNFAVYGGCK